MVLIKTYLKEIGMNFKRSPLSIFNKDRRQIEYFKGVYEKKNLIEIESYEDSEDENKKDTIQVQDTLMLDRISI